MPAADLERLFPNLRSAGYSVVSPPTDVYNCVAWAAEVSDEWWWPEDRAYRPVQPKVPTTASFIDAFQSLGYQPCDSAALETGYEKVAIYLSTAGFPTHVARQLETGQWTSKLGELEDVIHTLEGLEGPSPAYGSVEQILRRLRHDAGPVVGPS